MTSNFPDPFHRKALHEPEDFASSRQANHPAAADSDKAGTGRDRAGRGFGCSYADPSPGVQTAGYRFHAPLVRH